MSTQSTSESKAGYLLLHAYILDDPVRNNLTDFLAVYISATLLPATEEEAAFLSLHLRWRQALRIRGSVPMTEQTGLSRHYHML